MTSKVSNKGESGFTIIEVVLVLAIAGLIFLIVFLALPQLRRSQRDTQRRSDSGRVGALLESYAANSDGLYPPETGGSGFAAVIDLAGNNIVNPNGGNYTVVTGNGTTNAGQLRYRRPGRCIANGTITSGPGGARAYAIAIGLEGGGAACVDSQN